jgi:hypothetical protein
VIGRGWRLARASFGLACVFLTGYWLGGWAARR